MQRRQFLTLAPLALLAACAEGTSGPAAGSLLATAASDPDLTTFAALVQAAGLNARLDGLGPFTVFAPTNAAFARLGNPATLPKPELQALLLRHVGRGGFTFAMLSGETLQIATLDGGSLVASGTESSLKVDRVPVLGRAVHASNGSLFKIAKVLPK